MEARIIELLIELIITIIAFLVGRYILPKMKTNVQDAATQFTMLLNYASSYVSYAKEFLNCPGTEKMNNVVEKLKALCQKYNINIDEETLRAIGQKAYDAMKAGEAECNKTTTNTVGGSVDSELKEDNE